VGLIVVKCGGAAGVDATGVCADIADLLRQGGQFVLVHGGSSAIDRLAARLGVRRRAIVSPAGVTTRQTDPALLEVLLLALLGQVQPGLLAALGQQGVMAMGLSGLDAGLIRVRRKTALRSMTDGRVCIVRNDHSGQVTAVDGELLQHLLDLGITPVLSPPGIAEDGKPVNVNADAIAAAVAVALGATRLVFLTAAAGLLADPADDGSLIRDFAVGSALAPMANDGMAVKLAAARRAVTGGVPQVVIADGRVAAPVSRALAGTGTVILAG
jgi:[amino group carrier protein]-L-2-aminoadipate 6-kinase